MSVTLNYFNYFFTYNGEKTNFKMNDFLKSFMKIPSEKRLKIVEDYGEFTMFGDFAPTEHPTLKADGYAQYFSNLDRMVYFGQYRDEKPYTGQKGKDIANEIEQDVLEITHCAFFPNSHLLILPYKHFGAKAVHLENYINRFLPATTEDKQWGFQLHQIEDGRGLSTILRSKDIRSLEIKFDMTGDLSFEQYIPKDKIYNEFFKSFLNIHKEMDSNVGTLQFGTGRKTSSPMDIKKILYFLQNSKFSSSLFQSAKVRYKDPDTHEFVTTDLKHEGMMRNELDDLDKSETGLEYIAQKILENYIDTDKMGTSKYTEHGKLLRKYESDLIDTYINTKYLK